MSNALGQRLLFVIGSPRSGTTLLMRMLHMHDDIQTRPEPHLLTPLAHLGYYDYVDKAPYDPFQSAQASRELVSELPNGEATYLEALRAYADTIYGGLLEGTDKRYFLDKTPAYALILPFLQRLYPQAVFVVLTRHPFAIFSSYAKSFFDDDWEAAWRFNPIVERYVPAIASFLRAPAQRTVHIRYEDLVAEPERALREICELAGLPYHDGLVNYGEREVQGKGLGDPTGVKQHSRPSTASVNAWAAAVKGRPERLALLDRMVRGIDDGDLDQWGTPRAELWSALDGVDDDAHRAATRRNRSWGRYAVQRRALLVLRRNIHDNALGRALRKVRFACDVLLRE